MLGPPVAFERFSNGFGVDFNPWIPQLGELCAIPLASQDGVYNSKASQPGNITDDMVDLQVHLGQSLVHVLHVLTSSDDQFVTMPQHGPHGADILFRPKCSPK